MYKWRSEDFDSIIIRTLSKPMKSQVLHTVWCNICRRGCRGNLKLITLGRERVTVEKPRTSFGNAPPLIWRGNVIRMFLGRIRRFRRTVSHIIATGLTIQEQAGKHRFLWAYLGTCTSSLSWVFPCTFCHRRTEEGRCRCESCTFCIYGRVWCTFRKHSSLTSLRWPLQQRK